MKASTERGQIRDRMAYVLGKMMDHSGYSLSRKCSPSDIDFILDSHGHLLVAEFKLWAAPSWEGLDAQRRVLDAILKGGHHVACMVVTYGVAIDDDIHTARDVSGFITRVWHDGAFYDGRIRDDWKMFVERWHRHPVATWKDLANGSDRIARI